MANSLSECSTKKLALRTVNMQHTITLTVLTSLIHFHFVNLTKLIYQDKSSVAPANCGRSIEGSVAESVRGCGDSAQLSCWDRCSPGPVELILEVDGRRVFSARERKR